GIEKQELGDRTLPPRVRGVLLRREFAPTLALALKLHPQTTQVIVVSGTSAFDVTLRERARAEFEPFAGKVAIADLGTEPLADLKAKLAQLPPHSLVLFTTLFRDGAGEAFVSHEAVGMISRAANAPVYGFLDQYLGRGIVGGRLYSASSQGAGAAAVVAQVLAGWPGHQRQLFEAAPLRPLFDWREMQRWGIRDADLPPRR